MGLDLIWAFFKGDAGRATLTITGLILAAIYFFANRKKRKLTYQIITRSRIISAKGDLAGKVTILFNDKAVQEVGLFQIKITNVGNVPILTKEYERPIMFVALPGTRFLEASIVETKPPTLQPSITVTERTATLSPTLLNARDSIEVKLLIADFDGKFAIDERIEGVELKPGHPKGVLARTYLESAFLVGSSIFWSFFSINSGRARYIVWSVASLALSALVLKYVRSLSFTAHAPNDYET